MNYAIHVHMFYHNLILKVNEISKNSKDSIVRTGASRHHVASPPATPLLAKLQSSASVPVS